MNYLRIYNSLIEKRKNILVEGYKEKHHIIPKCLGGSNNYDNLIYLSAREHFIAHQLLIKIYPKNRSLIFATNMMCKNNQNQKRFNNRMYEWLRKLQSEAMSILNKGKIISEETRKKMSISAKNKPPITDETRSKRSKAAKNRKHTEESKIKISESQKGRKHSEETKKLQSKIKSGKNNPMFGRKHSEETKRKMQESRKSKNQII